MTIHFGTDGIRGRANETLTIEMAYRIGCYLGHINKKGRIIIGRDTRLSGGMFEMALAAGISSRGCNVYLLEVCSTPSLIYILLKEKYDNGIMITASHNPYTDNGIKIISNTGEKISHQLETDIENYIYSSDVLETSSYQEIGQVIDYSDALDDYCLHLTQLFPIDLHGFKIAVDCANGSCSTIAKKVLENLQANVTSLFDKPDGYNINKDCGSTHIEYLANYVKDNHFDCGFAYDGDGDRCIAVGSKGQIIDGDKILYCLGKQLKESNKLNGNKIVTTVMANLGLFKKLDEENIGYEKTQVGDKYVYQNMCLNNYVLGGEQSGHIILSDYATTGDGLLTTLALLNASINKKQSLDQLTDDLFIYPQLLVNIEVNNKEEVLNHQGLKNVCQQVENQLAGNGRVLVRASGTEPLIRVMVEAQTDQLCEKYCYQIIDYIKENFKH